MERTHHNRESSRVTCASSTSAYVIVCQCSVISEGRSPAVITPSLLGDLVATVRTSSADRTRRSSPWAYQRRSSVVSLSTAYTRLNDAAVVNTIGFSRKTVSDERSSNLLDARDHHHLGCCVPLSSTLIYGSQGSQIVPRPVVDMFRILPVSRLPITKIPCVRQEIMSGSSVPCAENSTGSPTIPDKAPCAGNRLDSSGIESGLRSGLECHSHNHCLFQRVPGLLQKAADAFGSLRLRCRIADLIRAAMPTTWGQAMEVQRNNRTKARRT